MKWAIYPALLFVTMGLEVGLANPLDAYGFGARGMGLGGAMTALAEGSFAGYYNPAGLAHGGRMRLDLGYVFVDPKLTLDNVEQDVSSSKGFQGGVVLSRPILGRGFGFAMSLHLPSGRISRIKALAETAPRLVLLDNRPQRLVLSSSLGFEVVPNLHFGGGLTYLANTAGTLGLQGRVHLTEPDQTRLQSAVDVDLKAGRYASAGLLYTPRGPWRFGATWREAFSLGLDLRVNVHGQVVVGENTVVVPQGRLDLRSRTKALYSPQQVFGGVAYEYDKLVLSAEVGWVDWSRFPAPAATVDVDVDVDPIPAELPVPAAPVPPRFKDIFVPRFGAELTVEEAAWGKSLLRAGYFFERSPAPEQRQQTNYFDNDKHGLSMGAGLQWRDGWDVFLQPFQLDFALQWIHLGQRRHRKLGDVSRVVRSGGYTIGANTGLSFVF